MKAPRDWWAHLLPDNQNQAEEEVEERHEEVGERDVVEEVSARCLDHSGRVVIVTIK